VMDACFLDFSHITSARCQSAFVQFPLGRSRMSATDAAEVAVKAAVAVELGCICAADVAMGKGSSVCLLMDKILGVHIQDM